MKKSVENPAPIDENNGLKKTLKISGMMCKHCVGRVTKALLSIEGVLTVDVNLENETAMIELERLVDDALLKSTIAEAGYEVLSIENTK